MTDIAPTTEQPAADPVATEIATIKTAMADRHSAYWKNEPGQFGDTPMQKRYKELVEQRHAKAAQPASTILSPADQAAVTFWRGPGREMAEDYQRRGGFEGSQRTIVNAAGEFMQTMPEATRADFEGRFSALPVSIRMAVGYEFSRRGGSLQERMERVVGRLTAAEDQQLEKFLVACSPGERAAINKYFDQLR